MLLCEQGMQTSVFLHKDNAQSRGGSACASSSADCKIIFSAMACIILQVYDGTFSSSVVLGTYAPERDQTCWLAKAGNLSDVSLSLSCAHGHHHTVTHMYVDLV